VIGVGLGMIIGGALVNNVIDRALHATVFDYLAVHLGAIPLFVCNAPDIAISLGVLIWLAGEFVPASPGKRKNCR
ncbi:MAG TPA: signal peptidase II, partial [Rhizomicrobium sp.]|nr:signal peptidase II [Rhizomicrobium sp.]